MLLFFFVHVPCQNIIIHLHHGRRHSSELASVTQPLSPPRRSSPNAPERFSKRTREVSGTQLPPNERALSCCAIFSKSLPCKSHTNKSPSNSFGTSPPQRKARRAGGLGAKNAYIWKAAGAVICPNHNKIRRTEVMLLFFFVHVPYQNMIIIVEAWNESPTAPSLTVHATSPPSAAMLSQRIQRGERHRIPQTRGNSAAVYSYQSLFHATTQSTNNHKTAASCFPSWPYLWPFNRCA
jgi:hypothetical protein